ncbi:chemotaxis protein CheW [Methylomarinum sp. Ch1-1]|uniref:Chemotaxis protein CheW n=1 Tax=Methylomarinum roseum TaxID=3067653 RepID=A0AAU7NPN7_9GAMM|nr:chemotaxis protein CheW [Methylomarinum sp. Ch1-1]MDP4521145.1 chemotaxis protein CheW [Methylomarinum sp. Ch1-1]
MTDDALSNKEIDQFLTFEIAGEVYGVDILKVQEIRGWEPVREIPNTPAFIKGALNLRGSIVPIVDLRERFKMDRTDYSPMTVVIVLCVEHQSGTSVMGIVADSVSDVLDVNAVDIKEAPNLGSHIDTRYMRGMYVIEDKMVLLLNVAKLLNPEEFDGVEGL